MSDYVSKDDFEQFVRRYDRDSAIIKLALTGDMEGKQPGLVSRVKELEGKQQTISRVAWISLGAVITSLVTAVVGIAITKLIA